jgi:transcription factor C subunit 6
LNRPWQPFLIHKIYQLDYSRKSGEYRMLDCFFPQIRPPANKPGKEAKGPTVEPIGILTNVSSTGAWPTQVGVHRVSWNSGNGFSAAGLLGSGTASGLGRVDWLEGRWLMGRVPYVSIANMRKEVELEVSDEEDDDDDEDEGDEND